MLTLIGEGMKDAFLCSNCCFLCFWDIDILFGGSEVAGQKCILWSVRRWERLSCDFKNLNLFSNHDNVCSGCESCGSRASGEECWTSYRFVGGGVLRMPGYLSRFNGPCLDNLKNLGRYSWQLNWIKIYLCFFIFRRIHFNFDF